MLLGYFDNARGQLRKNDFVSTHVRGLFALGHMIQSIFPVVREVTLLRLRNDSRIESHLQVRGEFGQWALHWGDPQYWDDQRRELRTAKDLATIVEDRPFLSAVLAREISSGHDCEKRVATTKSSGDFVRP